MDAFIRAVVFAIAVLLAILGFMFILTTPVNAHVLTPEECIKQAEDIGYLHDVKQTGLPWEKAKELMEKDIALAYASGETYIRDGEDAQRLLDLAQYVWMSGESKTDLQMAAWYGCLMKYNEESF